MKVIRYKSIEDLLKFVKNHEDPGPPGNYRYRIISNQQKDGITYSEGILDLTWFNGRLNDKVVQQYEGCTNCFFIVFENGKEILRLEDVSIEKLAVLDLSYLIDVKTSLHAYEEKTLSSAGV